MTEENCRELFRELKSWISVSEQGIRQLRALAYELEDVEKGHGFSQRFETGIGAAGGVSKGNGFSLEFYTFAASLAVNRIEKIEIPSTSAREKTIAAFLAMKETKEKATDAYIEYNQNQKKLVELFLDLARQLKHIADIDGVFTEFVNFCYWLFLADDNVDYADVTWSNVEEKIKDNHFCIFEMSGGVYHRDHCKDDLHILAQRLERRLPSKKAVNSVMSKTIDKINDCYFQTHYC